MRLSGAAPQDIVQRACASSHIFILPSVTAKNGDQEGQPLVLQEAQCSGLPVLATRHSGIPESVVEEKSAFLVPERDVDALAERLAFLLGHPGQWAQMGQAGRQLVEARFDNAKLTLELVAIYQRMMGK